MKKIILTSLLLVIMLFSLTGCFSKTKISVEKFNSIMNSMEEETIEDKEFSYTEIDVFEGSRVDISADEVVHFFVLSGDQDAKVMFERMKNNIMSYKKETNTAKYIYETNVGNYNTYKISTGTHYGYVARVGNTVLFIDGLEKNEKLFDEIIEKLGY